MVVKHVGVLSVGKLYGAMGVVIGLIMGLVFAGIASLGSAVTSAALRESGGAGALGFGAAFGAAAIVVVPIFYGVFMFITGMIGAVIYNVLAKMVGGIEVDVS